MNCRPGDLAISINTRWPENIGLIVRVVRRHVDTPAWNFRGEPTWWCVCGQPMTWHFLPTTRVVKAHEGPVCLLNDADRMVRVRKPRFVGSPDEDVVTETPSVATDTMDVVTEPGDVAEPNAGAASEVVEALI